MTLNKLQLELIAKCLPADKIKEIIQNQSKVEELTINIQNFIIKITELNLTLHTVEKDRNRYQKTAVLLENHLRVDLQNTKNPWKRKYIEELLKVIADSHE